MTPTENLRRRETSRRRLLHGALATGGAVLAAAALAAGGEAAAAAKMSQKKAGYRDTPLGKSRCDNCGLWQTPAACKLVTGPISPAGWCNLYNSK
ncbi:MAG TPA: hypothetical protein VKQ54_13635 [Caulobacteraceae bacterium]|nr:hypothetical protein [Caulobacteraceae bacterium]